MAYEELCIVQEWLDGLKDLDVSVKKMFGYTACIAMDKLWAGSMTVL